MKNKLLVIGAGDIGRRAIGKLARRSVNHGFAFDALHAVTSNRNHLAPLHRLGKPGRTHAQVADLDRPGTLRRLPRDWTAMLHAAPPQSYPQSRSNRPDSRPDYRPENRPENRDQRTRNLLRMIATSRSPARGAKWRNRTLVYLSTSGVYGDCGGARITEAQPVKPHHARAKRRVDAERCLTRAAKLGMFRLIILRVPGIYAANRLPIERLKAGIPALRDEDDVYTNHIHAGDLATICIAALARARQRHRPQVRIYHASDDGEMKMGAWFDCVADTFGLPRPPRVARAEIAAKVSPALLSFMSESRRLDNARTKRELKVRLQFATAGVGAAAARLVISQA